MPKQISFLLCLVVLLPGSSVADDPKFSNRLAKESSPYLLQHAHNPVDWYPWGDEAFAKAKQEDKLVFLSVGYAACHWCHVMERESFVDPEIAKIMNEKFVCIKVDREERPDVDQIYMTAVQFVSGGSGGWPMSVFLLSDGRPFWGGTYFPARTGDRANVTGFLSIMNQVDNSWKQNKSKVIEQSQLLTDAIKKRQAGTQTKAVELRPELIGAVASALKEQFDPQYGGFGYAITQPNRPKFPEPSNLIFLIDRMRRESVKPEARASAKRMLLKSLDGMISGATVDHLGGGFHRYSVDRRWQIPHFEKMLYDNGQLASVYAEAFADSKRNEYRYVAEGICNFVLRELRAPGGAFYSALDADSEGEEGKFYRWTAEELGVLKQTSGFFKFAEVYRLRGRPNFEGQYYVPDPGTALTSVANERRQRFVEFRNQLDPTRQRLFKIRSERERPGTDVKILTAWNGLMIGGLADAGRILDRDDYTQAAVNAAEFVMDKLRDDEGRLLRSYAADQAKLNAYLDDYAFLACGLIALHRATDDDRWIKAAFEITDKQLELFWDDKAGGFYFTSNDHPSLIVRSKDLVDSAIPSGISVAAENLMYLADHSTNEQYEMRLKETIQSIANMLDQSPSAAPRGAAVIANYLDRN
jgi:uncharacterized protein YyaL (SSP411 family)